MLNISLNIRLIKIIFGQLSTEGVGKLGVNLLTGFNYCSGDTMDSSSLSSAPSSASAEISC